jgi:hypothetical protein
MGSGILLAGKKMGGRGRPFFSAGAVVGGAGGAGDGEAGVEQFLPIDLEGLQVQNVILLDFMLHDISPCDAL